MRLSCTSELARRAIGGAWLARACTGPQPMFESLEPREVLTGVGFETATGVTSSFAPAAVGDFDGDGDVDFATTSRTQVAILNIFRNNGSGTFTAGDSYDLGAAIVGSIEAGLLTFDADNDGDLDILTNGVRLYINNGAGVFGIPQLINAALLAVDVVVFNANNDNLPDLAIVQSTGEVEIALNTSGGGNISFVSAPSVLPVDAANTRFAGNGRVDSDTRNDLLLWNSATSTLIVALNTLNGAEAGPTVAGVASKPIAGNFSSDVFVDAVWIEGTNENAEVRGILGTGGTGGFTNEESLRDGNGFGYTALGPIGDFNGDGNLDLIALRQSNSNLRDWMVLLGSQTGIFDSFEARVFPIIGQADPAGVLIAGQFNADTRLDVIRYAGTTATTIRNVNGPTITTFQVPSTRVVPGETIGMSVSGLIENGARPISSLSFYLDKNQNGRYDVDDVEIASAAPASGATAVSVSPVFDDGLPAGQVKIFAIARDALAISAISEGTITAWTRVLGGIVPVSKT